MTKYRILVKSSGTGSPTLYYPQRKVLWFWANLLDTEHYGSIGAFVTRAQAENFLQEHKALCQKL